MRDTYDEPEPDRQATIPVGRTMWIHFQHFYNALQHDVDGCKVTFDYDTNYSLDVHS